MCFSHTKRHVTFRGWSVGVSYLVCKKFVTFPIGLSIWDNWPFNKEVSNHGESGRILTVGSHYVAIGAPITVSAFGSCETIT